MNVMHDRSCKQMEPERGEDIGVGHAKRCAKTKGSTSRERKKRKEARKEPARRGSAPTFYLLYRLPRFDVKGPHNQQLEGVIHKTVLHIRQKWLYDLRVVTDERATRELRRDRESLSLVVRGRLSLIMMNGGNQRLSADSVSAQSAHSPSRRWFVRRHRRAFASSVFRSTEAVNVP